MAMVGVTGRVIEVERKGESKKGRWKEREIDMFEVW
jgi:hypothetical protein